MFQNFWQRLIDNNYLTAISLFLKTSLCNAFFVCLFLLCFVCLFVFCFVSVHVCVLCVLSTYVLCVFAPQSVTSFQFLCTSAVENYLYAHILVFR